MELQPRAWRSIIMLVVLMGPSAICFAFERQVIDDEVQIGYGVAIGDVDGDGQLDILLADKSEIVWYPNPGQSPAGWQRQVMARQLTARDNVCVAARDLDGDGRVEVAVGANWNPSETDQPEESGAIFFLHRPRDPRAMWPSTPIMPHDPTVHRMHWLKTSDGYRLAVLPLHGIGNRDGAGRPVRLALYDVPLDGSPPRQAGVLDESMHMTHNFELQLAGDQDRVLVAGKEGLLEIDAGQPRMLVETPLSRGAGEARYLDVVPNRSELAAIETMHGNEVVFYQQQDASHWRRQVLDADLAQGHALAAGDVRQLGRDQLVAGWRNPNSDGKVGIRLYTPDADGTSWNVETIDDNTMACEDLKLADLDGDGRLDIIAAGRATQNLIVYWNRP